MSKEEQKLIKELTSEFERWEYLYRHGGSDPTWADGSSLNLIRNHIIFQKRKMEEMGITPDIYYKEVPPEVDRDYMARADEIRVNANKSLKAYKLNEDYLYLLTVIGRLNKRQKDETCIENVLGYVRGLQSFIEKDDLVSMRRHEHPARYIDSFTSCRKRVEELLGELPKKIVFIEDDKQLPGQMTIDDWIHGN